MSTFALSRTPSSTEAGRKAGAGFVNSILRRIRRCMQVGRDRRLLQTLPASLLADIGLERIEFRSAADGRRDVWIIPHR